MESLFKIGGWTYHPESLEVRCRVKGSYEYFIDLETCNTSAEMLHWIFHISTKRWATNEVIGDLVEILKQLLRPQLTLCFDGGESGPLPTGDAMRELIANHIGEKETFNIVTLEDWQELLLMEREVK
jgi:hypothetical protein